MRAELGLPKDYLVTGVKDRVNLLNISLFEDLLPGGVSSIRNRRQPGRGPAALSGGERTRSPRETGLGWTSREELLRDFALALTHRPGELARVARALGRYGVNLKSLAGLAVDGQVQVRLLPDEVEPARAALEASGIRFQESEVITVLLENRAGALAEVAEKLADANVNLQAVYVTGLAGDLVELAIVADDVKKAKRALE